MLVENLVTVVLTTCKRAPQIVERAIMSVNGQTYHNWELIVVDDSPQEYEFRKKIKEISLSIIPPHKLVFIQNNINKGACYSRNIGLKKAKGEYIAYIDDDDEWLPEKLEKQVNALQASEKSVALIYGPYYKVFEKKQERELILLKDIEGMSFRDLLLAGNQIGGMSMPLLRTEYILEVGGFDELMQSSQDTDLWLRILKKYGTKYLENPLVLYYVHEGERIGSNPSKKIQGIERINEKYKDYLENDAELWWHRHSILLVFYVKNKMAGKAFSIWWRCVKKCPEKVKENLRNMFRIIYNIIRQ